MLSLVANWLRDCVSIPRTAALLQQIFELLRGNKLKVFVGQIIDFEDFNT
jgi:hypothetical protein